MMNIVRTIFWAIALAALSLPASLYASHSVGHTPGSGTGTFENPIRFKTLSEFLFKVLDVIITIAFPIIVLMIIYTGFLFVKAQGKPDELKSAKTALVWTLIGAMLILGAFVLATAICGTIKDIGGTC